MREKAPKTVERSKRERGVACAHNWTPTVLGGTGFRVGRLQILLLVGKWARMSCD